MTTITLRNEPLELSHHEIETMFSKHNFFDNVENIDTLGFRNQYELKIIKKHKIIYDHASGVIWQQSGSLTSTGYKEAQIWLKNLNRYGYADFKDWRLPTLEEAMSLMESEKNINELYIDQLFSKNQPWIWTSDIGTDESFAWMVSFASGICDYDEINEYNYLRAVRSEKIG